jgi:hypothetical protein
VRAFLAASRDGDFAALLGFLDPGVEVLADDAAIKAGAPAELHGAAAVAGKFTGRPTSLTPVLVNGAPGAVMGQGRRRVVFDFAFAGDLISHIDVIADPEHLRQLEVTSAGPA